MFNVILHKQFEIDKEEIKVLYSNKETYLCKSIEAYLNCLELGIDNADDKSCQNFASICIFRLVSLWTQNSQSIKVNKIVKEKIFKIATFKFHILMHQLAARMSLKNMQITALSTSDNENNESLFQSTLIKLITNIAIDHPHHMLPIILAFSNSHKVRLI
jgi:ataxia telangiectasia mutated family protein